MKLLSPPVQTGDPPWEAGVNASLSGWEGPSWGSRAAAIQALSIFSA